MTMPFQPQDINRIIRTKLETGYAYEYEDRDWLKNNAIPMPRAFREFQRPPKMNITSWWKILNQGPMGSCQGHCCVTALAILAWHASGGDVYLFSRIFAYLASQKMDGLLGRDSGSVITSGLKLMMQSGLPFEKDVPYPNPVQYPDRNQQAVILAQKNYDAGLPFRVKQHIDFKQESDPWEAAKNWMAGGGAVHFGIWWPLQLDAQGVCSNYRWHGRGMHAVCGSGYDDPNDLMDVTNSHGSDFADHGEFHFNKTAFMQVIQDDMSVVVGSSDMDDPSPRLDWTKTSIGRK